MGFDRWWSVLRLRFRSLFDGVRADRDLDDELRDHVERETEAGIVRGLSREAARTAAGRAVGGVEAVKEACRDERRVGPIDTLVRDCRYAVRILRRSPAFTLVAIVSLTLGVGANTAIFQLINAVRLRPLPIAKPADLTIVDIPDRGWQSGNYGGRYPDLTYPLWEQLRANAEPFSGVLAWSPTSFDLAARGQSRFSENGLWVSGDFFTVLGVKAAAGRLFTAADDARDCGAPGVVISHAFWAREYGGATSAVGSKLSLNSKPFEVIGVAEAGFFGVEIGRAFDLAVPLCAETLLRGPGNSLLDARNQWWLGAMGRLKPGWTAERATSYLRSASPRMFQDTLPRTDTESQNKYLKFTLGARPGATGFSGLREKYDTPLWLLLAVAGVVLLIACANLANLLLARSSARGREMAVRLALGASRSRLVRQLLVESLLLAIVGAGCGALLTPVFGGAVVSLISTEISPMFVDLAPDWRLLTVTALLAGLTCVLFGLVPALRATRVSAIEAMKAGGRSQTMDTGQSRLRRALVAAQVALSLVLLIGGLLFGRSLFNLFTLDAGFQPAGVLQVDVDLTRLDLKAEARPAMYRELAERLRAIPMVEAAATTVKIPMGGAWYDGVFIGNAEPPRKQWAVFNSVSRGYFETLRVPIVAGRDFEDADLPGSTPVVIVNEAFARQFLSPAGGPSTGSGQDKQVVGMTFRLEGQPGLPGKVVTVAGVVGNTKYSSLREEFKPIVYRASSQTPAGAFNQYLLRTRAPFSSMEASVRTAVEGLNPDISFHFHHFKDDIRSSLQQDRLMAVLCGFFALVGAMLAAIGVYGVNAYSVAQRMAEIGIRMALGADRRAIVVMILREATAVLAVGLATGVFLAWVAMRGARGMLFGLQPSDPWTIGAAVVLLSAVAVAASYLPARRASRANPVTTLHRA